MSFIRPYLMGDAYVAVADDPSVLFYNPAGMAKLTNNTADILNPQLNMSDIFRRAAVDPEGVQDELGDSDQAGFQDHLGDTFFYNLNLRLPYIVLPGQGVAYGLGGEVLAAFQILQNPVLPGLHFEFFQDTLLFVSYFYKPTNQFQFGFTTKYISRVGIDKTFSFGELFAGGDQVNLDNDPAFQDAVNGVTFNKIGVDLGFLYRVAQWPGWFPRFGLSMLNIGGVEDGRPVGMAFGPRPTEFERPQAGELPQINTLGFAVSPVFSGVRYTIALDYVDFTRTVLPGNDALVRTRLGLEVGFGIRDDGSALVSLLAGLNALHPSYGFITRVAGFQIGFGIYTVELGERSGDLPDKRAFLLFSWGV